MTGPERPTPTPAPTPAPAPPRPPREFDPALARPAPAGMEEAGDAGLPEPVVPAPARAPRRWAWRLFGWSAAGLLAVAVGFDLAGLLAAAWAVGPWLGGIVGALLVAAVAGLGTLAAREAMALGRIGRIDELRRAADAGRVDLAGAVAALYRGRPDLAPALAELDRHASDALDAGERQDLVERTVLRPLDGRAYRLVVTAARDTAIGTALSPAALLDVVLVAWRNLRLVREVATLYGARPGWLGSLRLLRRMLANLTVAGVAEGGSDFAVEALGGTLAAALSARVGQGLLNGMLTARVGLVAMHLCRPLPFAQGETPSLGRIRQELLRVPRLVL